MTSNLFISVGENMKFTFKGDIPLLGSKEGVSPYLIKLTKSRRDIDEFKRKDVACFNP
jgi:hypothetical protein